MPNYEKSDVLIIGCGIAGGIAALHLANSGIEVTIVTRSIEPEESNTFYAQGGIIYKGDKDSPDLLEKDLLRASAGYANPKTINIMAELGPKLIEDYLLNELSIPFDKTPKGNYSYVIEGSHSVARILHAKDSTGEVIQKALISALKKHPNINLLCGYTAIDLLTPAHHSKNRLSVYDPHSCAGA